MLDFNVFDSFLDFIFIIDGDGMVVYCNEAAATFAQTSVRRVVGKMRLSDFLSFTEPGMLPFTKDSVGFSGPTPLIETPYNLTKSGKSGKVRLTVRPVANNKYWVFFLHDVILEETLAAKYRAELQQKEEYARNLEKIVDARTAELRAVNKTLNAILDSLGQGFFTFNPQGDCGDVFTKACDDILEGTPKQRKAWDVLAIPEKELAQFYKWMETAFKELLPFEDVKGLGPELFNHSGKRHVVLDYFPIRREKNEISDIVVVATDKTAEHQAQVALEAERQYASMIVKYLKNRDQFLQFLASVKMAIEKLIGLNDANMNQEVLNESFRLLHTLEGEAGTFSLRQLRFLARESQHVLEPFKAQGNLRADVQNSYGNSLENLKIQFEKFLDENANIFHISEGDEGRVVEVSLDKIREFSEDLKSSPALLRRKYQDLFLKVPVETRLKYFDSLIQSVAERLGKKVKPLIIEGGEWRIFPEPYQAFFSSLVHAFRNAVDHGLEDPVEREFNGKDPAGQIRVKIVPGKGGLHFSITDDGKGIDPTVIREKLKKKFPNRDFSKQSDEEVIQNVALPGFSSRDTVGEFSGRGVGLDALSEDVQSVGGSIRLTSIVGQGTSLEIFIPELGLQLRRSA